ncbi:MAG TPA: TetR family transcriptional regulator [Flavobacterium sp.]|jgi:AcrR family transcriptional regulator
MNTATNDKKNQILQVAERLFAEKGFDGTSIRNIAKEAGINIAMVSYYFGSKEKMLESLIISRASDLKIQLENLLREDLSPLEKINRLVELYITRISKNRSIYQIVHQEISSGRSINFGTFTDVKKSNLESLEKIINEGQDKGIFTRNVNTALIPPTIIGTYFQFNGNRQFYKNILGLPTDAEFEIFVANDLTKHIQKTIKALLLHED